MAYLENLAPPSACPDVENLPFFLPGDTAPGHLPFDPEDKTQSIFLLEDAPLSPAPFSQDSVQNIPSEPASPEKAGGGWSSRVVRSAWRRGREVSSWNKVVSRSRRCAAARRVEEVV